MARINLDTIKPTEVQDEGGSNTPLPAGKYLVNIYDVEDIDFSTSPSAPNFGRPGINVQFRIAAGRPHANRVVFNRVPMFGQFNPKPGADKGARAFRFFQFWGAVLGEGEKAFNKAYNEEVAAGGDGFATLLENQELLGKQVVIDVGHEQSTYHYNLAVKDGSIGDRTVDHPDFTRETIKGIIPASEDSGPEAPALPTSGTASFTL